MRVGYRFQLYSLVWGSLCSPNEITIYYWNTASCTYNMYMIFETKSCHLQQWYKSNLNSSTLYWYPEKHSLQFNNTNIPFHYHQFRLESWQTKVLHVFQQAHLELRSLTNLSAVMDPLLCLWGVLTWYFHIWTLVSPETVQARFSWGWKERPFTEPLCPTYFWRSWEDSASHTHAVPSTRYPKKWKD